MEWRTATLDGVIRDADRLIVEIAELDAAADAGEAFESRAYSDNLPPLSRRVPPGERATLTRILDDADMDDGDFTRTESWAAALQLGNAVRCSDSANGVDRALARDVDDIRGLENFDMQFGMFDGLSDDAQVELLLSIAEAGGCEETLDRAEAWLTGDLATLMATLERGFRGNEELRNTLLVERNHWFADTLAIDHLEDPRRKILLAVGVGHLAGNDGVIALLERHGYTIRRIQ